jgi:hypothetical protein
MTLIVTVIVGLFLLSLACVGARKTAAEWQDPELLRNLMFAMIAAVAWLFTVTTMGQDSAPRPDTPNPDTGENGVWIPQWLEREHVLDDARLRTCQADLNGANEQLVEALGESRELVMALIETENVVDATEARELALRQELVRADAQLERRTYVAWAMGGGTLAAIGALAVLFFVGH